MLQGWVAFCRDRLGCGGWGGKGFSDMDYFLFFMKVGETSGM
jgi:hypothetical protein